MERTDEPFHGIARRVIEEHVTANGVTIKGLASDIGVHPRSLGYWLSPDRRKLPAEILPVLCKVLGDYRLLDSLEERAGRVGFDIPSIDEPTSAQDLKVVQKLVKEVGEALQMLAETLEDHVVEDRELRKTLPALDDVIRECVRLKYWLRARHQRDEADSSSVGR